MGRTRAAQAGRAITVQLCCGGFGPVALIYIFSIF
jgi:hypothetical protein